MCVCMSESKHCTSITGRNKIFSESFLLQLAHKQREQTTTLHWGNFLFDRCFGGESLVDKKAIRKFIGIYYYYYYYSSNV